MEEGIKKTIKIFDFKKVHDVMVKLNWKWATDKGDFAIPSLNEIRSEAIRGLKNISATLDTHDTAGCICGGFVYKGNKIDNVKYYELYFAITWSDNYE